MSANFRSVSRRQFLASSAMVSAAFSTVPMLSTGPNRLLGGEIQHSAPPRQLLKTLKIGMVKVGGNLTQKFQAAQQAGFDGIELNSPGIDVAATETAIRETGLPVDGSVCSTHWQDRHTSPDPAVRAKALADLTTAVEQTHAVGGHTVLLVVGHGQDGPVDEIWPRSIDNIRKVLPLCAELGITIVVENVWNHFLYQHDGPDDQSADQFVKYVDEFNSPWVGMQFDIGNHWKYGNPADWIRQLGRRIVKLDIKGFTRQADRFIDITEGDLPWAEVRQALDDIQFHGWVAAEVGGGDGPRLKKVANQIDMALNIG